MTKLRQLANTALLDALKKEGERVMMECLNESDYTHRTYNLRDSYFAVIFSYGIPIWTKAPMMPSPASAPKNKKFWKGDLVTGVGEANEFLKNYKPNENTIELVVVAAMPYAHALENQSSGQHHKYKVISMAYDKLGNIRTNGCKVSRISNGQKVEGDG